MIIEIKNINDVEVVKMDGVGNIRANEEAIILAERANAGDLDARDELIKRYMGLVKAEAHKFYSSYLENDDLIQEGILGLMNAIKKFKPEKGAFTTVATVYIRKVILNAIECQESVIRIPANRNGQNIVEIVSIDSEGFVENDEAFYTESTEDKTVQKLYNEQLMKLLDSAVTAFEKKILMYCYGFFGDYSIREICEILNMSAARVKYVKNRALMKIRKNNTFFSEEDLCA